MTSADPAPRDPVEILAEWLPLNTDPARPLMTLTTTTPEGPDARTVLLSEWSADGFSFHTDTRSRKVAQIEADPHVALMLHLPEARRQLVVQGTASHAGPASDARVYRARSPYLQQLAWQNTVEFAGMPYPDRVQSWADFQRAHADDGFGQPPTWVGYLVRPTRITFWVGSEVTASRRTEYQREPDGSWRVSVRAG